MAWPRISPNLIQNLPARAARENFREICLYVYCMYAILEKFACMYTRPMHYNERMSTEQPRGGDGGLRPHMDDSDGMGVQRGAGHSPAGFFCPPQAPKNVGKLLRMYENTPTFTHLEHCHCRFRRRRLTFHNRISCSSSHSFRNPPYEVHVLGLVNQTEE